MSTPTKVLAVSGGGWKGAYSRPIAEHEWLHALASDEPYDGAMGTSVGALIMAMVVQGKLDELKAFWDSLDTKSPWFGIPGYLKPLWPWLLLHVITLSWLKDVFRKPKWYLPWTWTGYWPCFVRRPEALFSLDPLRPMLEEHLDPPAFQCPLAVGFIDRVTGRYRVEVIDKDTPKDLAIDFIMASSVMAFIMAPVRKDGAALVDGGHDHPQTAVPEEWAFGLEKLDAVFHQVLEEPPSSIEDDLFEAFLWVWENMMHLAVVEDLEDLQELAEGGVEVRMWAPSTSLGGLLDASRETLQEREERGVNDIPRFRTLVGVESSS